MKSPDAPRAGAADVGVNGASEPTSSIWLKILVRCAATTGAALALAALVALVVNGAGAAGSALLGWTLVAFFFGISLLIGHYVGRNNPSGALGIFAVTYAIKVVGFAAVLFLLGVPEWLDRHWFFGAAVGTVVLWQTVEVVVFGRARHQLYDEAAVSSSGEESHAG